MGAQGAQSSEASIQNSLGLLAFHLAAMSEGPGAVFKCCCPPCAVASHEGMGVPCVLACCLGCLYTMICWTPKPKGPGQVEYDGPSEKPWQINMKMQDACGNPSL